MGKGPQRKERRQTQTMRFHIIWIILMDFIKTFLIPCVGLLIFFLTVTHDTCISYLTLNRHVGLPLHVSLSNTHGSLCLLFLLGYVRGRALPLLLQVSVEFKDKWRNKMSSFNLAIIIHARAAAPNTISCMKREFKVKLSYSSFCART